MHNIRGEKSEHPAMEILKKEWYYTLPLIVITIFMLLGYSPGFSAILGIVSCIVISWFRKETRIGLKEFVEASRAGTESSLKIGATVGVIGIIIGVLTFSGLVLTFADIVIELAGGVADFDYFSDCIGITGPGNGCSGHGSLPDYSGCCGTGVGPSRGKRGGLPT